MSDSRAGTEARCSLIRGHDVVAYLGDFRPLVEDFELHLMSYSLEVDPFARQLVADGLAALGLHMLSRRRDEHVAWTISVQEPPVNLFFTADVGASTLVGRAFLDGVEPYEHNLFFSEVKIGNGAPTRSTISVDGVDVFNIVEKYYERSEQRPSRFFQRENDVLMMQSLPDTDLEWLAELDGSKAFALLEEEQTEFLETRKLRWRCGCDKRKILGILASLYRDSPDQLFGADEAVYAQCPRCGSQFIVGREEFDEARRDT
jgi:molecular chaperone Hsp33